ncbi:MAG: hypothetical protein FJ320_10590 [SAR202 cluster bacterium]|nr:hypothetical protein [SAR202 cluster bacterium]
MAETIGRPKFARIFAMLVPLLPLILLLQAIMFAGFYEEFNRDFLDIHLYVARISNIFVVLLLVIAFVARFPRSYRVLPIMIAIALLWIIQDAMGESISDARWLVWLHIPNAFILFGLTIALAGRLHRQVLRKSPVGP